MDPVRFDALARVLSVPDSRRRVLGLLTALPVVGGLLGIISPEETESKERRRRRKTRHKQRKHPGGRKKGCRPKSRATICAGQCGSVKGRQTCGKTIDCAPCTCATGCHPVCQACNAATGLCDPIANGDPCDDGDDCTVGETCSNGTCGGGTPKCPATQGCEAGTCCTTAGNTATTALPCCAGLTQCADGVCKADCCAGVICDACETCVGGACVVDATQEGQTCNTVGGTCLSNGTCLTPCQGSECPYVGGPCCTGNEFCCTEGQGGGYYCSNFGSTLTSCTGSGLLGDCPRGQFCGRVNQCVVTCTS